MMKKLNKTVALPKTLRITAETIKLLTDEKLVEARGGQMHTSFSCGNQLCTTH